MEKGGGGDVKSPDGENVLVISPAGRARLLLPLDPEFTVWDQWRGRNVFHANREMIDGSRRQ